MKKLTFWEKIDALFTVGTFALLLLLDLPFLLVPLMLIRYDNHRKDGIIRTERTTKRLVNELIRPEIETKYKNEGVPREKPRRKHYSHPDRNGRRGAVRRDRGRHPPARFGNRRPGQTDAGGTGHGSGSSAELHL